MIPNRRHSTWTVFALILAITTGPVAKVRANDDDGAGPPFSVGYWKNHADATAAGLPLTLGAHGVDDFTGARAIFDASKAKNAHHKLAAQLLAAKLNLGVGVEDCVDFPVQSADAILDAAGYAGPDSTVAPAGEDKENVLAFAEVLDQFNNRGCPLSVPGQVAVRFAPGAPASAVEELIEECDTEILAETSPIIDFAAASPYATGQIDPEIAALLQGVYLLGSTDDDETTEEILECFEEQPALVADVDPNFYRFPRDHMLDAYPSDPRFADGSQWALHNAGQDTPFSRFVAIDADIDILQAWDAGATDCSSVIVAVEDSGADLTHPDLVNNLWVNPNEVPGNGVDDDGNGFIDDIHGWDWRQTNQASLVIFGFPIADSGGDGPQDTLSESSGGGHGTEVAGIIGAEGNNGIDMAGICWKAQLMIIRMGLIFFPTAFDTAITASYIIVNKLAFGHNIRVINQSYGGRGSGTQMETDAYEAYELADILVVKAVDNKGVDVDADADFDGEPDINEYPCNSPARTANIICVTASTGTDNIRSTAARGKKSVDLAAPGTLILTLRRTVDGGGTTPKGISGTSYATPHVAGVAALAFAQFPNKSAMDVKNDILFGSVGPPAASGVDVINVLAENSPARNTLSGGRLRWPYTGDFGDAPESYGTSLANQGPLHWDIGNEFFGTDVTAELDAQLGGDEADEPLAPGNGEFVFDPPPPWQPRTLVNVSYRMCTDYADIDDANQGRYALDFIADESKADTTVYVNGWFDLDRDGAFEPEELYVKDLICGKGGKDPVCPSVTAPPANPNVTINRHLILPEATVKDPTFPPMTTCFPISSSFTVPDPGGIPAAVRFRLDYGQDSGGNDPGPLFVADPHVPVAEHLGRAQHGDVEDFVLEPRPPGPPFIISGTVRGPTDAIPDADVRVIDAGGNVVGQTTTGADGGYTVTDLEPGTYDVEVTPPAGSGLKPARQTIELDADAVLDFTLAPKVANLTVAVFAQSTAAPGDIVIVELTVGNSGPDAAEGLAVTITPDPQFVDATFSAVGDDPPVDCQPDGNEYVCTTISLAAEASVDFIGFMTVGEVPPGTVLITRATAASASSAPVSASGTTTIVAPLSADLEAVVDAPPTGIAGSALFVNATANNLGADAADAVTLSITPDPQVLAPFVTPGTGVTCSPDGAGFTCTAATLGAGNTFTVLLGGTIDPATPSGTVLVTQATVASTTPDPDPANNTASGETTVVAPVSADLAAGIVAPLTVIPGSTIFIETTASNLGPGAADTPSLTIVLDPLVIESFVSPGDLDTTCLPSIDGYVCTKPLLAAGDAFTVFVGGTVDPAAPPGAVLVNKALVGSATADPDPSNDVAIAETLTPP